MNATKHLNSLSGLFLTLAVTTVLTTEPVSAQSSHQPLTQVSLNQTAQNYTVLHVNEAMGSDQLGAGTDTQPYRTITHALQQATAVNTVILLAPGHYSQATGEHFPLRLRPGITIQGNAGEALNTMIVGGGELQVDNPAQHATVVMADRSGLANVVVSNPKGSGVWITHGVPVLRKVALVANALAGVQVTDGAPVIESSYFNRNQQGLAIAGNGQAIVRGNLFEATGQAITVVSPATPTINNNRIARNDVGIALKNNARPVLSENVLNDNSRNGVVEVESTPVTTATATEVTVQAVQPLVVAPTEAVLPAPEHTVARATPETVAHQPAIAPVRHTTTEDIDTSVTSVPLLAETSNGDGAIPIAVIPVEGAISPPDEPSEHKRAGISRLLARLNNSSNSSTAVAASSSPEAPASQVPSIPSIIDSSERLSVPSAAIPGSQHSTRLTPPGTVSLVNTFRYRVLVDITDAERLKALVPDAFRTQVDNQLFIQAGAYVNETDAQARLAWLQENGIDGQVRQRE